MPVFGFLGIKWYKSILKYEIGLNEAYSASERHSRKEKVAMKIVIDIDEITYKLLSYSLRNGVLNTWEEIIAKGIPLPINDIKSEINQIITKNKTIRSVEAQERVKTAQQALDIINKHIKKVER